MTSCDVPVSPPPTDAANPPTTTDSVSAEPFAGTSDSSDADKQSGPQTTSSLDCEQPLQQPVTSPEAQVSVSPPCEPGLFSPKEIRPFPPAPPRKLSGRRTGKTRILTDTLSKMSWHKSSVRRQGKAAVQRNLLDKCRLVQLPSLEVLESAWWLVARRKQLRNPTLLLSRKMTHHAFTVESCVASLAELRHWIRCEKCAHALCAGTSAQDKHFICENMCTV